MIRRITAIEPQQKSPQRMNIYLDGEFAFGLSRILAAWLTEGQELSEEKVATLQTEDELEITYQKALHYLGYRPRSSSEVRQNLLKRGVSDDLVEKTITHLQQAGLVNDREFARAWIENRNTFQPRSKSVLRFELHRKGLSDELAQPVLDELVDDQSSALEAGRKYSHRLSGLAWPEFRMKLSGFLARRGFSYGTLTPIVSEIWKESRMADDGETRKDKESTE
jgi:regulatory protein